MPKGGRMCQLDCMGGDILSGRTSYFNSEVLPHHTVSRCQVSVNKLLCVEVCHAISYLRCHLDHLFQCRRRAARVILQRALGTKLAA